MKVSGKCSWFGGPNDTGVDADEGLAFIYTTSDQPDLFLPGAQPDPALARDLDADGEYYVACRWNYDVTPREQLLAQKALVRNPKNGRQYPAFCADWGPHEDTGRVADLSPVLLNDLGLSTDDIVEVIFPAVEVPVAITSIVISSGHGKYVRGASGIIDEVDEARKVVPKVAEYLEQAGVDVTQFHDNTSKTQDENLDTIVNFHNSQERDLDISVHFNSYEQTTTDMGTECLYVSQDDLAAAVADGIHDASALLDRGPKYRDDLYFLNNTEEPAILIEVCFVDSQADVDKYEAKFDAICKSIAEVVAGKEIGPTPSPIPPPGPTDEVVTITMKINAPEGVTVKVRTVQE